MSRVSVVPSPWHDLFDEMLAESNHLDFASPFITRSGVEYIIQHDINVRGVTVLSPPYFVKQASDIDAIEELLDFGANMHSLAGLHAKIYLFDNHAIVTSANLTSGGLFRNKEYGILLSDADILEQIRTDFSRMLNDSASIDLDSVAFIRRLMDRIPPETQEYLTKVEDNVFIKQEVVIDSLVGWNKEVYKIISAFSREVFALEDLYDFKDHFSKLYPANKHIEEKIRQILQHLRDFGLIEFCNEPGTYKRLVQ
ncbi:MAG: hypothetical protein BAJATHORv1_100056 [Candidatus Thorarchaeota archaeon]|nr:MAG: hypothetical protein BAJATHORv1_100056 [Candidatus Thorarchaeota archaeon]